MSIISLTWMKFFGFGVVIRVAFNMIFGDMLLRRVEIVSPASSWYRIKECVALSEANIHPYSGDICHHPPLLIYIVQHFISLRCSLVFIIADLIIAIVLYSTAISFTESTMKRQREEQSTYASDTSSLLLDENQLKDVALNVMAFYLFNPLAIATCQAYSTEVFTNLAMSLVLLMMVKEHYIVAGIFVSVAAYLSLYPIILLVPVSLHAYHNSQSHLNSLVKLFVTTVLFMSLLLLSSYYVYGSYDFLHAVYGFLLRAPDLTPNMGLFWYFFAEMFDHFRLFFLWVYQINVFIYAVPVAIIFSRYPMLVSYVLLSLIAIFKSYSNVGSSALPLALLPLWSCTFRYRRNVLLVSGMLLISLILAPGMWYLWIYAGSGNANFFYAVTLAYATGHIFLVADMLYAFQAYCYHLQHGLVLKTKDGKEGFLVMK